MRLELPGAGEGSAHPANGAGIGAHREARLCEQPERRALRAGWPSDRGVGRLSCRAAARFHRAGPPRARRSCRLLGERAVDLADLVRPEGQRTRRGDRRVLLAQGPRRGVARVGEGLRPLRFGAPIQGGERGRRHVDLAAHLEVVRSGRLQLLRHVADRGDVGGDVLSGHPVAARRGLDEAAVDVGERHRDPVDLRFAGEVERLEVDVGQQPAEPVAPCVELGLAERVVEAHHRDAMADRREELRRRRAADALGRRVRGDDLGVVGLDPLELAEERVVVGVGDLGGVEDVVAKVVVGDQPTQLGSPLGRCAALGCGLRAGRFAVLARGRHPSLRHPATIPAPRTASGSAAS